MGRTATIAGCVLLVVAIAMPGIGRLRMVAAVAGLLIAAGGAMDGQWAMAGFGTERVDRPGSLAHGAAGRDAGPRPCGLARRGGTGDASQFPRDAQEQAGTQQPDAGGADGVWVQPFRA